MSDRELLELAAKAVGLQIEWSEAYQRYEMFNGMRYAGSWNPLTDDGDALRLAVSLGICVYPPFPAEPGKLAVAHTDRDMLEELCGIDPCAATRRVIVRAAAQIGKATS
ncbi:hypothetical protein [Pseudomonas sp. RGM2987]|uniref:hypothetical protein n=1 Tax=Pseudomonas sp. RGM2987 TaxID=2930090 RepID=UPI001FD6C0EC|nr:hypothetical protein [Pseudomonas sp. RGM2987]MCJ8207674.1 hypothetical protein [Pseudomonas sp. RGM2987]